MYPRGPFGSRLWHTCPRHEVIVWQGSVGHYFPDGFKWVKVNPNEPPNHHIQLQHISYCTYMLLPALLIQWAGLEYTWKLPYVSIHSRKLVLCSSRLAQPPKERVSQVVDAFTCIVAVGCLLYHAMVSQLHALGSHLRANAKPLDWRMAPQAIRAVELQEWQAQLLSNT